MPRETSEVVHARAEKILRLRANGKTFRGIAQVMNLSENRVRQIYAEVVAADECPASGITGRTGKIKDGVG
jgi:Sigma-70, region 4